MQWDDYTTNEANIRRQWIQNKRGDDFPVHSWRNDIAPVGLLVCVFFEKKTWNIKDILCDLYRNQLGSGILSNNGWALNNYTCKLIVHLWVNPSS